MIYSILFKRDVIYSTAQDSGDLQVTFFFWFMDDAQSHIFKEKKGEKKKKRPNQKTNPTFFSVSALVTLRYFSSLGEDEQEAVDLHFLPFLPSAPLLKGFTAFRGPVVSFLLELSVYAESHIYFCCVGMKCAGLLSTVIVRCIVKECVYLNISSFLPPAQRPAACP